MNSYAREARESERRRRAEARRMKKRKAKAAMKENEPYDPIRRLCKLGLPVLARAVLDNNEVTITTKSGAVFSIFKAGAVVGVSDSDEILLGDPMGRQLVFKPHEIKVSFGVCENPYAPGISWQRRRESFS
jgi:hypothetical protein